MECLIVEQIAEGPLQVVKAIIHTECHQRLGAVGSHLGVRGQGGREGGPQGKRGLLLLSGFSLLFYGDSWQDFC